MSPRKLIALIDADRKIEDASLSRLAYVIATGEMPPSDDEDEGNAEDYLGALYF